MSLIMSTNRSALYATAYCCCLWLPAVICKLRGVRLQEQAPKETICTVLPRTCCIRLYDREISLRIFDREITLRIFYESIYCWSAVRLQDRTNVKFLTAMQKASLLHKLQLYRKNYIAQMKMTAIKSASRNNMGDIPRTNNVVLLPLAASHKRTLQQASFCTVRYKRNGYCQTQ